MRRVMLYIGVALLTLTSIRSTSLLMRGANVNVRRQDGWTPLGLAESRNHTLVVQKLREVGGVN